MLPITPDLLTNRRNRPYLRDAQQYALRQMKGVVAHWTANTQNGANARANRNYFNNTDRYASAHYIVDDNTILQCIPDNEVAYHVGSAYYRPDGETIIAGTSLTPNYFLLGIEMCVNADGDWDKTYRNAVGLFAHLLYKYRLTVYDMYRHYDITGKDCPKMMLTESDWWKFRRDISSAMSLEPERYIATGKVTAFTLNARTGPGISHPVAGVLHQNDQIRIFETRSGWHRIDNQRWVSVAYIQLLTTTRLAEVSDRTGANVRTGPGLQNAVTDALPYAAMCDVYDEQNGWYNIGANQWLYATEVQFLTVRNGVVAGTDSLNVRSGPGTSYRIVRILHRADSVFILEESNSWYRIGLNEWVYAGFIQLS